MTQRIKLACAKPFTLRYVGKNLNSKTDDERDYINLIKTLKATNIPYHTYTSPRIAVLKGLPKEWTLDDIKAEIQNQVETVKSVHLMRTTQQETKPIYMIKFENGTLFNDVTKISHLFYLRVYWHKYAPQGKTTQCFNCQEYGHGQSNCGKPPQCFKCRQKHPSRECKKPTNTAPTCALCKGNHLSNSRKCKDYVRYAEKLKSHKKKKPKSNTPLHSKPSRIPRN